MNTNKRKAFWLALFAGVTGWLSYIAIIPPSEQDRLVSVVIEIFPVGWRGEIGAILRAVAVIASIYATTHAARSGPQTPPANPSSE